MREFVLANERHPESVRVFPWLRPAAADSVSAGSAGIRRIRRACLFSPRLLIKKRLSTPQQITPKFKIAIQEMVAGEVQNQFYINNLDQPSVQKVSENHSKSKITDKKNWFWETSKDPFCISYLGQHMVPKSTPNHS